MPYVSLDEFKRSPTGIDTSKLDQTARGDNAAQDASLTQILRRASAWVDSICRQTLQATSRTELKEVHMASDGRIVVHPNNVPLVSIDNVRYRLYPTYGYSDVGITQIQKYDTWFTVYGLTQGYLSPNLTIQDPSFGYYSPYRMQGLSDLPITLEYTYTHGYASTEIGVAANINDTSITVKDATGIVAGTPITVFDGGNTEYCVVQSVSGNVLTLEGALVFAHDVGTGVSNVPDDLRQATILLAGLLIRERGSVAITMNETTVAGVGSSFVKSEDYDLAKTLLRPYNRVVSS